DDERHAGAASGINNTIARVAGLLAIAIFGAIAITIFARELDVRLAAAHVDDGVRRAMRQQSLRLAEAAPPRGVDEATRKNVVAAVDGAFVRAFRIDMLAAAALAAMSAGGAVVIKGRRAQGA